MDLRSNHTTGYSRCSARLLSLLLLPISACALFGVEPDEIDVAVGTDSAGEAAEGDTGELGTTSGADTGFPDTGDGDADSEGDGDGDGGDGDGDTGDGDGDTDSGNEDGDGDGDPDNQTPCAELGAEPLALGPNPVVIPAMASALSGSCGHPGPEMIYSYTSDADVNLELSLIDADFDGALYAVDGELCLPLVELACVNPPELLPVSVGAGQTVYVVVDSIGGGSGTLELAVVP